MVYGLSLLLGGGSCVSAALRAQPGPREETPAGVNNDLLRTYFRNQYMTLHSGEERQEAPVFVDQFVDRRIEYFLQQIEDRLTEVRRLEEEIRGARATATPGAAPALKKALRQLERELGDLRGALSPIFLELKSKSRFRPSIEASSQAPHFAAEFEFLHDRINRAERTIREYLFSAGSTVSVGTLQEGDMLISLVEAARMARSLSREF